MEFMEKGRVDVVLGLQRGDEGKGRVVDYLAKKHEIVARFNGGSNAGHKISVNGQDLALNQVPSGILHPNKLNIIGNGVLLNPALVEVEITNLRRAGVIVEPTNLAISDTANLVLPHHISMDEIREAGENRQGSTINGIAYAARDKYERSGLRVEDLRDLSWVEQVAIDGLVKANYIRELVGLDVHDPEAETRQFISRAKELLPFITDTVTLLNDRLDDGASALGEGAQAYALDIEHGMYPFVTSSHTTTGGVLNGLGVGPGRLGKIVGVAKAVKSHVGDGPFVTEITDAKPAEKIRGKRGLADSEYGTRTGRPRRVGYLDLPELRRAIKVNGVSELALTKLDHLQRYGKTILVATHYKLGGQQLSEAPSSAKQLELCEPVYQEIPISKITDISGAKYFNDLPAAIQNLVGFIEEQLDTPVNMLGVGRARHQLIVRR